MQNQLLHTHRPSLSNTLTRKQHLLRSLAARAEFVVARPSSRQVGILTHHTVAGRSAEELGICLKFLAQDLGVPAPAVAFPSGLADLALPAIFRRAGAGCALTAEAELVDVKSGFSGGVGSRPAAMTRLQRP